MKKILLALSLLFSVQVSHALTHAQMITEIRRLVQDSNGTSRQRWTDVQISTFMNMAQDEIANLTWCMSNVYRTTTIAGTTEYIMPSDYYVTQAVYYGGKVLPEISLARLDTIDEEWLIASTGTPTYYYVYVTTVTKMGIYPSPDQAQSLDIYYTQQPTYIYSDTDKPFNGNDRLVPYHYLIILWVAHYCALQEGKYTIATQLYNLYSLRVTDMRNSFGLRPNYSPTISASDNK